MFVVKNFARLGISVLVLSLAACGGNGAGIEFDSTVAPEHRSLIEGDLALLSSIALPPANTNDLATIGVGALTPAALNDWLGKRLKMILGQDFNYKANARMVNRSAPQTPFILAGQAQIDPSAVGAASSTVKTVMWNLGSYLYLDGKKQGFGYYLDVDYARHDLYTPRVGIVQEDEGLFTVNAVKGVGLTRMVNRYLRIATYFHEARHSDGNGTNAGFPHAKCPGVANDEAYASQQTSALSAAYAGKFACEDNLNGPYAIQATLLSYMYQACTDCTAAELTGLELSLADYKSRLLPTAQYRDSRPEGIQ